MNEHYIVTANDGQLRIYAARLATRGGSLRLEIVEAMDFPKGFSHADGHATGAASGGRSVEVVAAEVSAFMGERPGASWDFAGAPDSYEAMMAAFAPDARRRLRCADAADLVGRDSEEVRAHFTMIDA